MASRDALAPEPRYAQTASSTKMSQARNRCSSRSIKASTSAPAPLRSLLRLAPLCPLLRLAPNSEATSFADFRRRGGALGGEISGENAENVTGIRKFGKEFDPRYLAEQPYSFGVAERKLCLNLFPAAVRITSPLSQVKGEVLLACKLPYEKHHEYTSLDRCGY
jgi:hypothetical protein